MKMICWLSGRRPQYTVRALQVEQYSNRPGARVAGFGEGAKNFWGDAYAAETRRLWNASEIW